jgi:polysaccharide export outer membrane protein
MTQAFHRLVSLLLVAALMCSCADRARMGCRPCKMVRYCPCIIDYAPECDCGPYDDQKDEPTPIPREFLDPKQLQKGEYRIHVGDILEISLLTHDENTVSSVIVAPDGNIYYSFLDAIPAVGRTPDEVAAEIEAGIARVLVAPSVLVVPRVKSGQYYMILGKVFHPGVFPLDTAINLRQAIGIAGGISLGTSAITTGAPVANLDNSFVVRGNTRLDIDFASLVYGGNESQNIYLRPGDYIYIASALNQDVYVLGAVPAWIAPWQPGLTLAQVLAPSYGPETDDPYTMGNWHDVLIIRGRLCCPCVIRVDFKNILYGCAKDVYLQPGDLVYVPHKTARFGRLLVRLAVDAFVGTFVGNVASFWANKLFGGNSFNE